MQAAIKALGPAVIFTREGIALALAVRHYRIARWEHML